MDRHADEPDSDMFTDAKESFQASYRHGGNVQLSKEFVMRIAPSASYSRLAAGLANAKVSIVDTAKMTKVQTFSAYESGLNQVKFSSKDDQLVYTCSSEEPVKLWDLRDTKSPAKVFKDESETDHKKPLISMDVNCEDMFLAAGTEQVVQDAFVLFWDIRNEKMHGGYWDSYGDAVTSIQFHPKNPNKMATGGTDCLINVFDISQSTEEDALVTTLNSESSIRNILWYNVRLQFPDFFSVFFIVQFISEQRQRLHRRSFSRRGFDLVAHRRHRTQILHQGGRDHRHPTEDARMVLFDRRSP